METKLNMNNIVDAVFFSLIFV
uniref:DUF4755 domain-containing protein n=1 Tax=Heterorhabditis bacteriophora TaxID=37862 RepID=A0A1I7WBC6_HETBA